jgi:hypothetical protein
MSRVQSQRAHRVQFKYTSLSLGSAYWTGYVSSNRCRRRGRWERFLSVECVPCSKSSARMQCLVAILLLYHEQCETTKETYCPAIQLQNSNVSSSIPQPTAHPGFEQKAGQQGYALYIRRGLPFFKPLPCRHSSVLLHSASFLHGKIIVQYHNS